MVFVEIYNMTAIQASATVPEFIYNVNLSVGQHLVGGFFIAFFFVFLMALRRFPLEDTIVSTSFVFFILSILLRHVNLIGFYVVELFFFFLALSSAYIFIVSKD